MAIRYKTLTQKEYDALVSHETDMIYYVADTGKQYLNGQEHKEDADLSKNVVKDFNVKADLGSDSKLQVNGGEVVTVDAETGKIDPSLVPSVGGGVWGAITGTLADQTDLKTALDGKANTSDIPAVQVQSDWDESDSSAVDYIKNKPTAQLIPSGGEVGQVLKKTATSQAWSDEVDVKDYLCFTAINSNTTIKLKRYNSNPLVSLEYSRDKIAWTAYNIGSTEGDTITLANPLEKVYFRGNNDHFSIGTDYARLYFSATNAPRVTGNVMSLLDKTCELLEIPTNYCFYMLFQGCGIDKLSDIKLPAMKLKPYCYQMMFQNADIANPFAIPVSESGLASNCCKEMYGVNVHIKEVDFNKIFPNISNFNDIASNLSCFAEIFSGCANLHKAKIRMAPISTSSNFSNCFKNISYGVFESDNNKNVPSGWTFVEINRLNSGSSANTALIKVDSSNSTIQISPSGENIQKVAVASSLVISASNVNTNNIAYAEVVLDIASGATVTAGTNMTFVDTPTVGKRNVCVVRWSDGVAKLYVTIVEDIPQA